MFVPASGIALLWVESTELHGSSRIEHALIGHVVDREDTGRCVKEWVVPVVNLQHRHHRCRMIVMSMDHVWLNPKGASDFERCSAQEDETPVIVMKAFVVAIDAGTVEVIGRCHKVDGHVGVWQVALPYGRIFDPRAEGHLDQHRKFPKAVPLGIDRGVERKYDDHRMSLRFPCLR